MAISQRLKSELSGAKDCNSLATTSLPAAREELTSESIMASGVLGGSLIRQIFDEQIKSERSVSDEIMVLIVGAVTGVKKYAQESPSAFIKRHADQSLFSRLRAIGDPQINQTIEQCFLSPKENFDKQVPGVSAVCTFGQCAEADPVTMCIEIARRSAAHRSGNYSYFINPLNQFLLKLSDLRKISVDNSTPAQDSSS